MSISYNYFKVVQENEIYLLLNFHFFFIFSPHFPSYIPIKKYGSLPQPSFQPNNPSNPRSWRRHREIDQPQFGHIPSCDIVENLTGRPQASNAFTDRSLNGSGRSSASGSSAFSGIIGITLTGLGKMMHRLDCDASLSDVLDFFCNVCHSQDVPEISRITRQNSLKILQFSCFVKWTSFSYGLFNGRQCEEKGKNFR